MARFHIVPTHELAEEQFQTIFEACGDSDPAGIANEEGEIIGLVVYDKGELAEALTGTTPDAGIGPALIEALKDVVHVGDYGTLWLNSKEQRVHLTMGDSDGEPETGLTSFDTIRARATEAVRPFWGADWSAGTSSMGGRDGSMEIADEWSPYDDDWREVGRIGKEQPFEGDE